MLRRYLVPLTFVLVLPAASQGQSPSPISRALPDNIAVTRDLVYATYGDRRLLLDLYMPADRDAALLPAIVVIRGGGWRQGDKEGFGPMAAALANRGLVAVSIEYRASGEAAFPAAVHDTKAAVRWLRANAAQFGLDPEAIGAIGGSAGAHLATYLGLTPDIADLEGFGGNHGFPSAVSVVVGLATHGDLSVDSEAVTEFLGVSHERDPGLSEFASPGSHVDESSPPLLLLHSETDRVIPFTQSLRLAERYGAANVPVEVVLIPDAPHAFWNFREWFAETMDRSAEFFWLHLGDPE